MKTGDMQSERRKRVLRVKAEATRLFGSDEAASKWMNTPTPFVPGNPPITPAQLAKSESGARLLENRIGRTVYGAL